MIYNRKDSGPQDPDRVIPVRRIQTGWLRYFLLKSRTDGRFVLFDGLYANNLQKHALQNLHLSKSDNGKWVKTKI